MRVSEGIFDFFKKKEKTLADDPEYKGWLKMYTKNKDVASMHKRHKEFLQFFQQADTNENMVTDLFKHMWSNDNASRPYAEYLEFAKKHRFQPDSVIIRKMKKQFPEFEKNDSDLKRVMIDIRKLKSQRA